jgi:class 3 adenylate cyclase
VTKPIERAKDFKPQASRATNGVAVIFDLGGFSKFFNLPDVHTYIPRYLNHVTKCVETAFFGGPWPWGSKDKVKEVKILSHVPVHRKFLGDGALYIWTAPKDSNTFSSSFLRFLVNRLWILQKDFDAINKACANEVPVFELPANIRFGVARGTVFELLVEGSRASEYIGVCVNLASRLQKYCPGLNFIASARLELPPESFQDSGYIKVIATKIKGFPKEIVIVNKREFDALNPQVKKELFIQL